MITNVASIHQTAEIGGMGKERASSVLGIPAEDPAEAESVGITVLTVLTTELVGSIY